MCGVDMCRVEGKRRTRRDLIVTSLRPLLATRHNIRCVLLSIAQTSTLSRSDIFK